MFVDVIEDSFSDEQFFRVARELVDVLFRTASNESVSTIPVNQKNSNLLVQSQRPHNLKAIAVSVFRSCLEILEMMKSDYEHDVRSFLSDALAAWVPFFVKVVDIPLLQTTEQLFQGLVTLKIQVIRVSFTLTRKKR